MLRRLLTFLSLRLNGIHVISKDKKILLERRYIVNTPNFGLYLHKCTFPDTDPDLFHDHPWSWSFSIILSGYYIEVRPGYGEQDVSIKKNFLNINFLHRSTFHRLSEISQYGVWTLYFRGKRVKKDGFLVRNTNGKWSHILAENSDYESENYIT